MWRILRSVSEILVCLSNKVVPSCALSFEVLSVMFVSGSSGGSSQLAPLFDVLLVSCMISYFRGVILKSN